MYRKWICLFSAVLIFFVAALCALNYAADPFGYFDAMKNEYTNLTPESGTNYCRLAKPKYIKRNPEKYDMFIFGGSNAGVIKTETVNAITGKQSYNSYFHCGTFEDYYAYLKFYIANCPNFKELLLHISNDEMHPLWGNTIQRHIPSFVTGESKFIEFLQFTVMSPTESFKTVLGIKSWKNQKDNDLIDGTVNPEALKNLSEEELIQTNVFKTETFDNFDARLEKLFTQTNRDFRDGELCIENLKKIKSLCDENGIRLTVAIGATFIGKKSRFEGEQYYSWLQQLVSVTPIWDFGGFFDANLNPYNFYEADHYNYETADEMLKIIYGQKQNPDFGVYLTAENVGQYVAARREKFAALRTEYEATGTVRLFGRDDASCLGK